MATAAKPKAYTLDIFSVLDRINKKDYGAYKNWSEAEQKAFQPYVAMKWMFGTENTKILSRVNSRVNPYVFALGQDHKELVYMLLCAAGLGKPQRYTWVKTAAKPAPKPMTVSVIMEFYGYSERHSRDALPLFDKDEVLDMAQWLGRETVELTKIKNEFKASDTKAEV